MTKQLKSQIKIIDDYQNYLDFQKRVIMENCEWFHKKVEGIVAGIHKLNNKHPFLPADQKKLKKLFQDLNYFEKKAGFEQKTAFAYGAKEEMFGKAKSQFFMALKKQQMLAAKKIGE
jgi:hypothetical protein